MPYLYDNYGGVRSAFDNRYWPAPYFVDADDIIRGNHLARDATSNRGPFIQHLLGVEREFVSVKGLGVEAGAEWNHMHTP
ncbi:hypothetical protein [Streptomyces mirabilis]|uniref:hypothetical protein n=1 Tax=Streptomyces mirabilis TaxID=68239 RepID=UPI0035D8831C